ncbi:MAG TPA: amidohydrolase family protein [Candidatus Angelobacter sp.]|nr:amidohydrolase family protein [Candidatus Angelobacter sp.]
MKFWIAVILVTASFAAAQNASTAPVVVEKGSFTLHLLLHPIGQESYEITQADPSGGLVMNTQLEYSDRGRKRTVSGVLRMNRDLTPSGFEVKSASGNSTTTDAVEIHDRTASISEGKTSREAALPGKFFVGFGYTPASVQMMMVRYWSRNGEPASIPILRANPVAEAQAAQITFEGRDSITVGGHAVPLKRYTVANVVFGREVLWFNQQGQLAAAMNFAGGLPFDVVRSEYEPALAQLLHSGVSQEMRDLAKLEQQAPPVVSGSFAIVGATLVDGTDHAPVADSVVIIREGRIVAAGKRDTLSIPRGMKTIDATGKTLLPGLWEMHTHFSGVEFGPAMLAAGITTARDCGGDFEFLTTLRDAIDKHNRLGPRLLLAGLVDASGPDAFGAVSADTPEEARKVVAMYKSAGFQQLKLYTLLKPDVIQVLSHEAHQAGMTVTGHVPSAVNAIQGVEAGMDQINHLGFVTPVLRAPDKDKDKSDRNDTALDLNSEQARKAIQFFQQHHTVIDPTASWGEMAGRSKDMDIPSFEPGIAKAPYTLATKFMSLGAPASESVRVHRQMEQTEAIIGALHKAGIPIVAGSDTGLLGYGLDRELELYVKAGMTPLEAIQTATIVPARVMNLASESGSIEPGKRADLILVDGNPLENISDIRKVIKVVANGRMYDSAALWKSVGFQP